MSDPQESRESPTLSDWTLISSQGEIVSGDGDSESSESSIEIVSVEGNDVISQRLERRNHGRQDSQDEVVVGSQGEVVVAENPPSAESAGDNITENESVSSACEKELFIASAGLDHKEEVHHHEMPKTTLPAFSDSICATALQDAPESCIADDNCENSNSLDDLHETQSHISVETVSCKAEPPTFTSDTKTAIESSMDSSCDFQNNDAGKSPEIKTNDAEASSSINISLKVTGPAGDSVASRPQDDGILEMADGACCMELLAEREGKTEDSNPSASAESVTNANNLRSPSPTPVSQEEAEILNVSGASSCEASNKTDSDTDSDFVCLDHENMEALAGTGEGEERVIIPLRLCTSTSSIGPGFNFMRGEGQVNRDVHERDFDDEEDEDQTEDTESSTEEGVDDRIESEQSEAGSHSAQNDVGDLSVFADIGDLPLEAGNVPRNYIHRPNNNLSTVLNIVMVLAAILTMGISLGIIMATDLEIEEWQNAYEIQAEKVNKLERQLEIKKKDFNAQGLELNMREMHNIDLMKRLKIMEWEKQSVKRAYENLIKDNVLMDKDMEEVRELTQAALDIYVECEKMAELYTPECHLELLNFLSDSFKFSGEKFSKVLEEAKGAEKKDPLSLPSIECGFGAPSFEESSIEYAVESYVEEKETQKEKVEQAHKEEDVQDTGEAGESHHYIMYRGKQKCHVEEDLDHARIRCEGVDNIKDAGHGSEKAEEEGKKGDNLSDDMKGPEHDETLPLHLDIKQLQQSMTRAQERALHWQQLYLAERRQRERDQENEELEDEREREMWIKEQEQMDGLECLKKLMHTNLTTLTQHVTKWNVSVFDDFANLSVLLSGVAELKQTVLNSFHGVWEGAKEAMGNMQGYKEEEEREAQRNSVPDMEMFRDYLSHVMGKLKQEPLRNGNKEMLIDYLSEVLRNIKYRLSGFLEEVNPPLINLLNQLLADFQSIVKNIGPNEEQTDWELGPDLRKFTEYLSKALIDFKFGIESILTEVTSETAKPEETVTGQDTSSPQVAREKDSKDPTDFKKEDDDDGDDDNEETHIPPSFSEKGKRKDGKWTRRIGKILKKTGKLVRKLGRKVVNTWHKLKNLWLERDSNWQKIKNTWLTKKPSVFDVAKDITNKVMAVTTKFTRMCTKLPKAMFRADKDKSLEVDIHSKCTRKMRKQWQKQVLHDPCKDLGKFSFECNTDKTQLRKKMKEVSHTFSRLLEIKNVQTKEVLKLKKEEVEFMQSLFTSFGNQWGYTKFLLKTDMRWIDCQTQWWSMAIRAVHGRTLDQLPDNSCDVIRLQDNVCDGQCKDAGNHGMDYTHAVDDNKEKDYHDEDESAFFSDYDDLDVNRSQTVENKNEVEVNDTLAEDYDNFDWYLERARYRLQSRREKERAEWMFDLAANRKYHRNENKKPQADRDGSEKKQHYEKTKKHFEKSSYHSSRSSDKWEQRRKQAAYKKNARNKRSGNWFMAHAEERQKQRREEHQADWVFERAADRKENRGKHWGRHHNYHRLKHHSNCKKYHCHKAGQEKGFRHAYGRVFTP